MCGQALERENVFKTRGVCWRKGFCVIHVSPMFVNVHWRVEKRGIIPTSNQSYTQAKEQHLHQANHCSRTGEKPSLPTGEAPLGNWGKLIKYQACTLNRRGCKLWMCTERSNMETGRDFHKNMYCNCSYLSNAKGTGWRKHRNTMLLQN